jgi:tRNA pseudouridine38-40 synthase
MRTLKAIIEYDGTDFVGWQRQKNGRSVQEELESVLRRILQERITVTGAGRTDAGVHATGQVAHFRTGSGMPLRRLLRALNGLLPKDITVRRLETAAEGFHARRSAKARTYRYRISTRPTALDRDRSWVITYRLDRRALQACAETVRGIHDFRSFSRRGSARPHYRCVVLECTWRNRRGGMDFVITADRFLHGMVRSLVGTMVDVARGYRTVDEFRPILAGMDRRLAGPTAPPQGLFLERVHY